MSMDWNNGRRFFDEEIRAIHDGKVLEQEPCENVPDLYECLCGYGWDKNKVVRHHFCPNCGRAVDGSIKTEQEPSSSEKPNKWVPVSERLPEIHQDVILSLRSLDIEVGFRAETEPYFYCHGADGCYIDPKNVLAWMPLPEPYKSEIPTGEEGSE